jgi:hypothetical protein
MVLSKELMKNFIRMKKWTTVIKLMKEGEVDMPLKFTYDTYMSFKSVCLRLSKDPNSKYAYVPRYRKGSVTVIKSLKDGESSEQRMQAE